MKLLNIFGKYFNIDLVFMDLITSFTDKGLVIKKPKGVSHKFDPQKQSDYIKHYKYQLIGYEL